MPTRSTPKRWVNPASSPTPPVRAKLFALRSGGVALVEHGRAGNVTNNTIASSLKNDAVNSHLGDKIVFYAEDVLRGYRVDIFTEQSGVWNSLCQRVAEYGWADGAGPRLDHAKDEGYAAPPPPPNRQKN